MKSPRVFSEGVHCGRHFVAVVTLVDHLKVLAVHVLVHHLLGLVGVLALHAEPLSAGGIKGQLGLDDLVSHT